MTVRLAIDTATDRASVALSINNAFSAQVTLGVRQAASSLVTAVDVVLKRAGASIEDVTEVVIADGPGSFTGLRIGFATAAGLIAGREVNVWTVASLAGTASGALSANGQTVVAMYDALRGDVYTAGYGLEDGRMKENFSPRLVPVADLSRLGEPHFVVGNGGVVNAEAVEAWIGVLPQIGEIHAARAGNLLDLDRLGVCAHECLDLSAFEPDYGRLAEAQVRWEAEHGKPLPDSSGTSL